MMNQRVDSKQQLLEEATRKAAAAIDTKPSGNRVSAIPTRAVIDAAKDVTALKSAKQRENNAAQLEEQALQDELAAAGLPTTQPQVTPQPVDPSQLEMGSVQAPDVQPPAPVAPQMNPLMDAPAVIGAQAANDEMSVVDGYQKQLNELERKNIEDVDAKEVQLQKDLNIVQDNLDQIASGKVSEDKIFSSGQNALGKILMLIGAGFGAAAGQKDPLALLNRTIDAEIAAQDKLMASKLSTVKDKVARYQDLLTKYQGNKKAAQEARRAEMYQMAQLKLTEMAQKSKDVNAQQELQLKAGELGLKVQEAAQKAADAAQLSQGQDLVTQKIMKLPAGAQAKLLESKQTYDGGQLAFKAIDKAFNQVKDIGVGGLMPLSDAKTYLETQNAQLEGILRNSMKGTGAITDKDADTFKPYLPRATDTASQRRIRQAQMKEFIKQKISQSTAQLQGFGLLPKEVELKSLQKN